MVQESLFSQSWYRVAELRPRLRTHAQIHRHTYRDSVWYVLQDHSSGRFHRFSPEAYLIIGLLDGKRTVQQIWEAACERLGDDMPTQDEVVSLLSQLHRADVLQSDLPPDIDDLRQRRQKSRRSRLWSNLRSPLAIRIPLLDPERFLSRTLPWIRPMYTGFGAVLWLAMLIWALTQAAIHWDTLTADLSDRILSLENLALLWLAYPLIKALHEFGHAYAVKRWGGEVHEMGVMMLVLMPIPYVDASAASAFRDRRHRMIVGAAGMMVELLLASFAMVVWVNSDPGTVRALAFNVMLIAGVSTVLFNGNPLLRYDGYYILADFLELPNLAQRATRYVGYLAQRYLLRVEDVESPAETRGEALWLASFAVASYVYRIFIMIAISLFIAGKFFIVGVLLALWSLVGAFLMPIGKLVVHVAGDPRLHDRRLRAAMIALGGVASVLVLLLLVPMPSSTVAEGVVWATEQAQVRPGTDCFAQKVLTQPGQKVHRGDPLIACSAPQLGARVQVLEAQLREFEARYQAVSMSDRAAAEVIKEELGRTRAELAHAREQSSELVVRSPGSGVFQLTEPPEDLPGRFLKRGTSLGYVLDASAVTVRVVVPQSDVDEVRSRTRAVQARLAEDVDRAFEARIEREVPAASQQLPSLALSLEGGGLIALDPNRSHRRQAFQKLFQFDVVLPDLHHQRVGERVYVRFTHPDEPLAFRWYRGLRRLLLSRFSV